MIGNAHVAYEEWFNSLSLLPKVESLRASPFSRVAPPLPQ